MTTRVGLYREPRNKRRPWVVRWFGEYDPDKGKHRHYSKAFATKREAERFQVGKQVELDRGTPRDGVIDITIAEFVRRYEEANLRKLRPQTRYKYLLTLEQLVQFSGPQTPLRKVTPELADRFVATRDRIADRGSGYSTWSRNTHLRVASIAFNVALRWGYVYVNPFAHIRAESCTPRSWHHLKPEEFSQLVSVVEDRRWRASYYLAYTTGLRFGELFNLTWADVDFDRSTVLVQDRAARADMPPFHVKDHEARTLFLPRQTVEAVLAWQAKAPNGVPYVLLTRDRWRHVGECWRLCRAGKPWRWDRRTGAPIWRDWDNRYMINNVLRTMRVHARRAGIHLKAPLTMHTLRKSFGQNHADSGTPIHHLQAMMGHASITTTRKFYLQAPDANDRAAVARYEALLDASCKDACVRLAYGASWDRSQEGPEVVTPSVIAG